MSLEKHLSRVKAILQENFCDIAGSTFDVDELFDVRSIFKPRHHPPFSHLPVTISEFTDAQPEVGHGSTPDAEVLAVAIVDNLENPDENIILYLTEGSFFSEVDYLGDVSPMG